MTLTVTAVVPTCRRPLLLERALRSIAAQTHAPTEVIVVDDTPGGPAPAIAGAVARSGAPGVRVIPNRRGPGPSGARNTGAQIGTGDLIAFLDDDDEWRPEYLQEARIRCETDGLDLLGTDCLLAYENRIERRAAPEVLVPEQFLTGNPGLVGSNVVIRRALYCDAGGFDESLPAKNDRDFGLRLSLRPGIAYGRSDRPLVCIHQHRGPRISTPGSGAMRRAIRRFFELHAHRMTAEQRAEFRRNERRMWGDSDLREIAAPGVPVYRDFRLDSKPDLSLLRDGSRAAEP